MKSRISKLIFGLLLCASAPAFADLFGGTNPLASSSGASTTSTNTWTAGQTFGAAVTLSSNVVDGSGSQGTAGQSLQSNAGSAPTWVNVPSAILATTSSWTASQTFSSATATAITVGVIKSTQGVVMTNSCGYVIGSVVQSTQAIDITATTTSGTSYNVTNTSATIIPKCATNQIIVTITGSVQATITSGHSTSVTIFRNGSDLSVGARSFITISGNITGVEYAGVPISLLDSPASTSAQTYVIELKSTTTAEGIWNPNADQAMIRLDEIAR